nr:MAG TPA: hypothetical protein [Caudoviricetes sp.]
MGKEWNFHKLPPENEHKKTPAIFSQMETS